MALLMMKPKLAGSSLVEVTVAMVILLMAFGMSLMILLKVTGSGNNLYKVRGQLLMRDYVVQSKLRAHYVNELLDKEGFVLERTVSPYKGNLDLIYFSVKVKAQASGLLIDEHQELIYNPRAEN